MAVNSVYSNNSRITGMYSEMDTDALVKSMCSAQQTKIDKQEQKITKYEWQNEAINSVIKTVDDFSNTYASVLGASSMLKSSTYSTYKVISSSNSSAAVITASSTALTGDISLKINQLAKNSSISSSSKVSADGVEVSANNTAKLSELSLKNKLVFNSKKEISFGINGKTFTFSSDTTLQNMINTINNDSDANVTMTYSRLSDSFSITSNSGGEKSSVSIVNYSGNAFGENSAFMIDTGTVKNGVDAEVEINGITVKRDSNKFSIDGISYDLKKVTQGTTEEVLDFTISRDFSSTVDAITKFVDAYNELTTKLTSIINAKDYSSDYPPLTEAQKEEMTEEQIKTWEERSKSGLLHNDKNLEKMLTNLKNAFFSNSGGTGKNATSIGISTGSYFSTDKGKLVLDKDTLTAALEKNPDQVVSIFAGGSSTAASTDQGLIYKMKNTFSAYQKNAKTSISTSETSISDGEEQLTKLKDRLDTLAAKYYAKFSAMETALSKLNTQSSYISQMFNQ